MLIIRSKQRPWKRREHAWRPTTQLWVRPRCLWRDSVLPKCLCWQGFPSSSGKLRLPLEMGPFQLLLLFLFVCWEQKPQNELGEQQTGLHQTRSRPGHRRQPRGAGGSALSGGGLPPPHHLKKQPFFFFLVRFFSFCRHSWATPLKQWSQERFSGTAHSGSASETQMSKERGCGSTTWLRWRRGERTAHDWPVIIPVDCTCISTKVLDGGRAQRQWTPRRRLWGHVL